MRESVFLKMSLKRFGLPLWGSCLLLILVLDFSPSETADLLSRCPWQIPRSRYLKAAADWGKCYDFNLQERSWREASAICARKGGHLVTIREERIQTFLLKALAEFRWPRNGLWIGATDKDDEMEWVWVTGEKVKDGYSRWAPGQPSCGFLCFEDCAVMRWKENGRWHDYRCSWLEDYSSICEYDMLPEPSTTVTSTTPTTTVIPTSSSTFSTVVQTAKETTPVNKTSVAVSSTGESLNAEYLLHGHMGTVAVVVITVLTSLAVGICIFFIMKRRNRKQIREDDRGIGYENPYYEEAKACLSGKGTNSRGSETDGEAEEYDAEGGCVAICGGKVDSAVGFVPTTTSKNDRDAKLPPVPPPGQQRSVMNNYDTPPAVNTRLPRPNKKDSGNGHLVSENRQSVAAGSHPVSKEAENSYDEIPGQRADSRYAYDVPRASRHQFYGNVYSDTDDSLAQLDHTYGNSFEENIYESVDNLQAIIREEQSPTALVENLKDDDKENRYVPFMFDAPTESS
ncbi:unnamed protein product [Candidula unifasciata]|uniref:C-type lectin domain-containing protein n=1 Tax=Candidula unifasciata TaxID=100452 RepID=A0A8S4A7A3_9EUPU|nr:unnamed protein product [Candidula unifasciata]